MNIDKTGRQDMPIAIHHLRRSVAKVLADSADAIAINGDVDGLRITAASVDYAGIPDKSVADRHRNSIKDIRNSPQPSMRELSFHEHGWRIGWRMR
jgi:hypothetical protein